jgi:hypothetical protein
MPSTTERRCRRCPPTPTPPEKFFAGVVDIEKNRD